jgi:hypothetical protein
MAGIKPDPDSDGESNPTFFPNENELLDLKEDVDRPYVKSSVMKFEPEVSCIYVHYCSWWPSVGWLVPTVTSVALCREV